MKKTLFLLMALASVAIAADTTMPPSSTFDFDFSDSLLSGASALRTVSFMDGNFRATITADAGTNTLSSGDWSTADGDDTVTIPAEGTPAYDYIKGGSTSTNLTLTLSNLVAGEKYSFSFTTGIPFEGEGNGNTISEGEGNTYASRIRTPEDSENENRPGDKGITTFTYTDIVADSSGKISIIINTPDDKHTPSFNVASLSGASKTATDGNLGYVFAASATQSGNAALIVREGSTGNNWAAAFGNAANPGTDDNTLVLTGNASIKFTGDYTGGKYTDEKNKGTTVFGIVNAGKVTGNVNLVFDAAHANYGSFSDTNAASVVGAYKGTIDGTFSATINSGTFAKDIMGGIHTGDTDSIGATSMVINGGTIGGNVYGGGYAGTITGNTAVTITDIGALKNHTADSIISGGGISDTINGNSTVTFSGITSGNYAGTVKGGAATNVEGTSILNITDSTLTLKNAEEFDSIIIGKDSSLTVTGNISSGDKAKLAVTFDEETAQTKTVNGFGSGVISGLISGEGTFAAVDSATFNGKAISKTNGFNLTVEDSVYYVMGKYTDYTGNDADYTFVLSSDKRMKISEAVHVGNHSFESVSGPVVDAEANSAMAYYVGKEGTLCISGNSTSSGLTAGQMLTNIYGDGNVILRTGGYESDTSEGPLEVFLTGATKAAGNLYLSPKVLLPGETDINESKNLHLYLEDGADISSFSSVTFSSQKTELIVNGALGADENGHHINNLSTLGSSTVMMYINSSDNDEIVLGGTTSIKSYLFYEPQTQGLTPSVFYLDFNQDATVHIDYLDGGNTDEYLATGSGPDYASYLCITSAFNDKFASTRDKDIVGNVIIDSFDFRGYISFISRQDGGSLNATITLQDNQWLSSAQYSNSASKTKNSDTLTLQGTGTYVLEEGCDIQIKFGRLSEETNDGEHIWQGTVELTNVDATNSSAGNGHGIDFSLYGNNQSTVAFNGFKGDVVTWNAQGGIADNQPDSVNIESALVLTNTEKMSAYEVTGGITTQNYTGAISGEGDFVVSATNGKNINLSGELKGWNGNLKATAGEQNVTLSGAATTVNAAIKTEGGSLNLTVDNSGKTTTFNKGVQATALKVNDGSVAELTQESSAGNIAISTNGGNASLSAGITISGSMLSDGHIADAAITAVKTENTVELSNITAEDLYLYGEDAVFHSEESAAFFYTEDVTAGDLAYTEVSFSSDIFKGMTLSDDGAKATITVSNTILDGGLIQSTKTNNVTIFLEGFTIEALINRSGVWNWDEQRLSFNVPEVATLSGEVTVQELLAAKYASVTYSQTASGLMIRMQNIPEPTTATLSLLALAGLAARRRRK